MQKIIDKGFEVKLPPKLFREITLPASVEQSVTFKGRTVSLDARPLGLQVTPFMLWYGVALGAEGAAGARARRFRIRSSPRADVSCPAATVLARTASRRRHNGRRP